MRRLLELNRYLESLIFLLFVLRLHLDYFALGLHDMDIFFTFARNRLLLRILRQELRIISSIVRALLPRNHVATLPFKMIHHFVSVPLVLAEWLNQLCIVEQIVHTLLL